MLLLLLTMVAAKKNINDAFPETALSILSVLASGGLHEESDNVETRSASADGDVETRSADAGVLTLLAEAGVVTPSADAGVVTLLAEAGVVTPSVDAGVLTLLASADADVETRSADAGVETLTNCSATPMSALVVGGLPARELCDDNVCRVCEEKADQQPVMCGTCLSLIHSRCMGAGSCEETVRCLLCQRASQHQSVRNKVRQNQKRAAAKMLESARKKNKMCTGE